MGGFYNQIFGYGPGAVLLAPMLTERNPQRFFPRFRDCYAESGRIVVYTRVGGDNRSWEKEPPHNAVEGYDPEWDFHEDALYEMPTFVLTWDDTFDETYGYYVFDVPQNFKDDFAAIMDGRWSDLSDAYCARVAECFDMDMESTAEALRSNKGLPSGIDKAPDYWRNYLDELRKGL